MNFPFSKKNRVPELSQDLASQMLQNIFEACQTEPNSIPLDVLISYSNYRKERFAFQKYILIATLILFALVPFLFIYPDFTVTLDTETSSYPPVYTFALDTPFPAKSVMAELNGKSVPVSQTERQTFSIEPTENGVMQVSVTLINNQVHTETIEIDTIDTKHPVYQSSVHKGELVYLYVSDDISGIDYEHITANDSDGNSVKPYSYDKKNDCIIFLYLETDLDVYVPDMAGNTLHLILNIH